MARALYQRIDCPSLSENYYVNRPALIGATLLTNYRVLIYLLFTVYGAGRMDLDGGIIHN